MGDFYCFMLFKIFQNSNPYLGMLARVTRKCCQKFHGTKVKPPHHDLQNRWVMGPTSPEGQEIATSSNMKHHCRIELACQFRNKSQSKVLGCLIKWLESNCCLFLKSTQK